MCLFLHKNASKNIIFGTGVVNSKNILSLFIFRLQIKNGIFNFAIEHCAKNTGEKAGAPSSGNR
jgi:hypothetical protein